MWLSLAHQPVILSSLLQICCSSCYSLGLSNVLRSSLEFHVKMAESSFTVMVGTMYQMIKCTNLQILHSV